MNKNNNKSHSLNINNKNKYYKTLKTKSIDFLIFVKEKLKDNLYILIFFLITFIFISKITFLAKISQEKYILNKIFYTFSNIQYLFKGQLKSF